LVNELNLDIKTKVRIKEIEVEVIEGDLKDKPWLIESEGKNYILLEEKQYDKLLLTLKDLLQENLELKLEFKIMNEFPIDLEDVKAVVKKEIKENNLNIDEAIKKVKTEHPNLFHKLKLEDIFNF